YRLYETGDGWICVAAVTEDQRRRLGDAVGVAAEVAAGTADEPAAKLFEEAFRAKSAREWFDLLDGRGVPCEISAVRRDDWYDDPDAIRNGWVVGYEHPVWGWLEQPGTLVSLSATPGRIAGPPPIIGAD